MPRRKKFTGCTLADLQARLKTATRKLRAARKEVGRLKRAIAYRQRKPEAELERMLANVPPHVEPDPKLLELFNVEFAPEN
jgi:hypothetical protein